MAARKWHKLTKVSVSIGLVWIALIAIGALGLAASAHAAAVRYVEVAAPVIVEEPWNVSRDTRLAAQPEAPPARPTLQGGGPPIVDGLFYSTGEDQVYSLLAENPSESKLYYYLDGDLLYAALVISPAFNDNVFGDTGDANDKAYVKSAGWKGVGNQHDFVALYNSDHAVWNLFCAGNQWAWQQDYLWDTDYDHNVSEPDWRSDPYGIDGTPPPASFITSASSLQWNMNFYANNPTIGWDVTLGGTRGDWRDWKSYAGQGAADQDVTDDEWPMYFSSITTTIWEWHMVYECVISLTVCGGDPFTLWPVTGHNSPPKTGTSLETSNYDWGDLPDTGSGTGVGNYQTLGSDSGAYHRLVTSLYMGNVVDPETDGQPTISANGDDTHPTDLADDEDGVYKDDLIVTAGLQATVRVTVTNQYVDTAYLYGFIDFNGDGDFDDANEVAYTTVPTGTVKGVVTLDFGIVPVVSPYMYARFRLSSSEAAVSVPTGLAPDGEVEDYPIEPPTGFEVLSFAAMGENRGIRLSWETASEVNILGFNLYRAEREDGAKVQVNEDLILSLYPGSPSGAVYKYTDMMVAKSRSYYYWVGYVDLSGTVVLWGPIKARTTGKQGYVGGTVP